MVYKPGVSCRNLESRDQDELAGMDRSQESRSGEERHRGPKRPGQRQRLSERKKIIRIKTLSEGEGPTLKGYVFFEEISVGTAGSMAGSGRPLGPTLF